MYPDIVEIRQIALECFIHNNICINLDTLEIQKLYDIEKYKNCILRNTKIVILRNKKILINNKGGICQQEKPQIY